MSAHEFFIESAKKAVGEAVRDLERRTSAEVLVAVRRESGQYRDADFIVGAILAMGWLCLFLYHPEPFDFTALPLEIAGAFAVGALLSAYTPTLRRSFSTATRREREVKRSARAAFVDLGVSRTHARRGVLVYVSLFELRVDVVPDVGIDVRALGARWDDVVRKLDRTVRLDLDVERFTSALAELGALLAERYPREAGDTNELPDTVDQEQGGDEEDEEAEGEERDEEEEADRDRAGGRR